MRDSLNFGFWAKSFPFGIFRVAFSFFAGVLLFRYKSAFATVGGGWLARNVASCLVLVATAAVLTAYPAARWQPFFDFFAVTIAFPAIVAAGIAFQPAGRTAGIFRFLGLISYAVYTLHAPLSGMLIGRFGNTVRQTAPISGLAFLAALVIVCVLADRYFDTPVRKKLLRRLAPQWRQHTASLASASAATSPVRR